MMEYCKENSLYKYAYTSKKQDKNLESKFIMAGCPHSVMVKVMDNGIVVREFKIQLSYYIHFWTHTLGKGMSPLIFPARA